MSESRPNWWHLIERMIVRNGPWISQAVSFLRMIPPGEEMTGEEINNWILAHGCEPPSHHNLRGGLISHARARGLIVPTGRYWRRARSGGQGEGHLLCIYRRTNSL